VPAVPLPPAAASARRTTWHGHATARLVVVRRPWFPCRVRACAWLSDGARGRYVYRCHWCRIGADQPRANWLRLGRWSTNHHPDVNGNGWAQAKLLSACVGRATLLCRIIYQKIKLHNVLTSGRNRANDPCAVQLNLVPALERGAFSSKNIFKTRSLNYYMKKNHSNKITFYVFFTLQQLFYVRCGVYLYIQLNKLGGLSFIKIVIPKNISNTTT
jgi:hypothetical protein